MTEENVEEKQEEEAQPGLDELLSVFPDSPSKENIEQWKQQFGEVFCSGFSDIELFVWRPINRKEFIEMQTSLAQAQQPVEHYQVEEMSVNSCVLWASPQGKSALNNKAGSFPTLYEQIMQNSNFMNPAMASALVVKL